MPLVVSQPDLSSALRAVAPVVGRGHLPVMASVRLEARGDELLVSASSAEATVRHVLPLVHPAVGIAVVPARPLARFTASVEDHIALDLRPDAVVASSGRVRMELRTVPVADWVEAAEPDEAPVTLRAGDVRQVRRVLHAAAPANPMLAGVRFEPGWVIALDGYRMAAAKIDAQPAECVVPLEAVSAAVAEPCDLEMVIDGPRVRLSFGATTFTAATIAGAYPDWRLPLPEPETLVHRLAAKREALLTALRRVEALGFTAAGVPITRVDLAPSSETTFTVRSADAALGECDEEVDGTLTASHVAFNATYLQQAVEQSGRDDVEIKLSEGVKPAVLAEDDHIQLVMPIRS